jgi:hypothetical protein
MATSKNLHCVSTIVGDDIFDTAYSGACWILDTPVGSNISPDADGVMGTTRHILVDTSYLLSEKLGRQMPMTATYRLKGLQIGLRNVDDTDDNDRGAFFGGTIFWHSPTKHKIDALQTARYVEYLDEATEVDADSKFFAAANQKTYSGFRFNWNDDLQIKYPTSEGIGNIAGNVCGEWNLQDTLTGYSYALQGNVQPSSSYNNALWGKRTGIADEMQWSAQILNGMQEEEINLLVNDIYLAEKPERNDYVMPIPANNHLDVIGGLILISVSQCNTIPNGDLSPDDYDLQISLQIEGWEKW